MTTFVRRNRLLLGWVVIALVVGSQTHGASDEVEFWAYLVYLAGMFAAMTLDHLRLVRDIQARRDRLW